MIIAGITGSIGTGKSTVAAMFADLGAFIIDWDRLGHQVIEPGKPAWQKLIDSFGKSILNEDMTINRQRVAQIVFDNAEKLNILNSIVHPAIIDEDRRLTSEIEKSDPDGLVIKDIPLLLEGGQDMARLIVDKIIVIYSSPETQINRLISRGMSEEDARSRIRNQIPVEEKIKYADFVIDNDGSLEETRAQVNDIFSKLISNQSI